MLIRAKECFDCEDKFNQWVAIKNNVGNTALDYC